MDFLPPKRKYFECPTSLLPKRSRFTFPITLTPLQESPETEERVEALSPGPRTSRPIRRFKKTGLEVDQRYEFIHEIGHGQCGMVCICRERSTDKLYACKSILKRGERQDQLARKEIEMLRLLKGNEGVLRLKEVFESRENFHLILELCERGSLWGEMVRQGRSYSEEEVAVLMRSLMGTIRDMHQIGIVHRDVKPENVLITGDGRVKLGDFGFADQLDEEHCFVSFAGTPYYAAPEVKDSWYTEKADIWSAGMLLYVMLKWVAPLEGQTSQDVLEEIKGKGVCFDGPKWDNLSGSVQDLLSRMLTKDQDSRPSAQEVLDHPWFKEYAPVQAPEVIIDELVGEIEKFCIPTSEFHGPYLPVQQHYLFRGANGFVCAAY